MIYIPFDHYWKVEGKEGFWSSKNKSYVSSVPD